MKWRKNKLNGDTNAERMIIPEFYKIYSSKWPTLQRYPTSENLKQKSLINTKHLKYYLIKLEIRLNCLKLSDLMCPGFQLPGIKEKLRYFK